MSVVKRPQKASQMGCGGTDDQDVKDLMRTSHDVELAGPQSLWHASCVDGRAKDVKKALEQQPIEADLIGHLRRAVQPQPVDDWKDGRQAHRDKHGCSERPPFGCSKPRQYADASAPESDGSDHGPVNLL